MKPANIDLRAEEIRAALSAIAEANGGYLNPAHVVEAARDPSHVLHSEFSWDDEEAADRYRIAQAGALIRRVKFTVIRQSTETKEVRMVTTRAFQSRKSARGSSGGYESVAEIMSDEDKRAELLAQVLSELNAYRKRYAELAALSDVWAAIDDALDLHRSAPSRQVEAGQARRGAASSGA